MNLEDLEGLTSDASCRSLQRLAAEVEPPCVVVEIGSFRGRTAIWMASQAKVLVYAIDPWDLGSKDGGHKFYDSSHRLAFDRQVADSGFADRIVPIADFSARVAKRWNMPIGLLHIDGWHDTVAISQDVTLWSKHLVSGGTIVIDDYGNKKCPDVKRYVDGVMRKDPLWRSWELGSSWELGWQAQAVKI